ncbi:MAG: molybdopterin oxidoreductase family protein [Rhodospirillales bacterium]
MAMEEVKGCCPLDCQDGCSWVAEVEEGRVLKVVGSKAHPFTRGILCAKVNDYQAKTYAADRLLRPLRRTGGKGSGDFRPVSWDDAIGEIAEKFGNVVSAYGAEALMPLHDMGSAGVLQRRALMRLFHALGASRLQGSLCAQSAIVTMDDGHPLGFDPELMTQSEVILLWGSNLLSTAHHHWQPLAEARAKRGATVIAIDPRRTRTAQKCDEHLPIRPGTDAILAAGIAKLLVDEGLADLDYARAAASDLEAYLAEIADWTPARVAAATGIPEADIRRIGRLFGEAKPGTIRAGVGPQQTIHGEIFVRSLSALAILSGHWRRPGGGLYIASGPTLDDTAAERADILPRNARSLDRARLGEILTSTKLDPPVKALMVWGHNPLVNQMDVEAVRRGLCREDLFTVVIDHCLTDTARHADIVLPSTTQLEHFDIQGSWGHHYVGLNRPAIPPLGEAKPHTEILRLLAARMNLKEPALFEDDETIARSSLPRDFDWEALEAQGWLKAPPPPPDPASAGQSLTLASGLPGPAASRLPGDAPQGLLRLLTAKGHYLLNSTFANMPRQSKQQGTAILEMHPSDAETLGLSDDVPVIASNRQGEIAARLQLTDGVTPGVVVVEGKRWWSGSAGRDAVTNRLAAGVWSARGQPAFNDVFVEVRAAD